MQPNIVMVTLKVISMVKDMPSCIKHRTAYCTQALAIYTIISNN